MRGARPDRKALNVRSAFAIPKLRFRAFLGIAALLAVAACGTLHTTQPAKSPTAAGAHSPRPHNSWLSYTTDVDPGSAVSFVTATAGWRLTGQRAAPYLDGNLAAGPNGAIVDWPGSGVAASADGGLTWRTVYRDAAGIWGIDLLSVSTGWVVGVTSLSGTGDGGATWRRLGEPAGHPLVAVSFVSELVGYGLTTTGKAVRTVDGGSSWSSVALPAAGGALCFETAQRGFVSAQNGDLYRTANGGANWTRLHATPFTSRQISYTPLWSSIACDGASVWQGLTAVTSDPPPGHTPYAVFATHDGGTSWAAVADNLDGASALTLPAAPHPLGILGGLAEIPGSGVILVGWPSSGWGLQTYRATTAAMPLGVVPPLAPPYTPGAANGPGAPQVAQHYLAIHGIAVSGGKIWLYYDDSAIGTASTVKSESVLATAASNGGRWSTIAISDQHTYH
jgi:hypothetical protein